MPQALVVPGVSVATRYEVVPPLPARSGVLGAVGVVDRDPGDGPRGVTTSQELLELFGPATRYSFPEALSALTNGISAVIVSPVDANSGKAARLTLKDDENQAVAVLRARAVGPWGNDLSVRVVRVFAPDGRTVRRVNLQVLYQNTIIERHENLVLRSGDASDLFTVINRDSTTIVAVDPLYGTDLPATGGVPQELSAAPARAATGVLMRGNAARLELEATTAGRAGNDITIEVAHGRASTTLLDASDQSAVRVRAAEAGPDGTDIRVRVSDGGAGGVDVDVDGIDGNVRSYEGLAAVEDVVDRLNADPEVVAEKLGDVPPKPTTDFVVLEPTRTIIRRVKGVSTETFEDLPTAQAIADVLDRDGKVEATVVGSGPELPDVSEVNRLPLTGGRDAGRARAYRGQNNPDDDILEIIPAEGADAPRIRVQVSSGTRPATVRVVVGLQSDGEFDPRETYDNLSMDPDDPGYLVRMLRSSELVRAVDLYKPAGVTDFPASTREPEPLSQGAAPTVGAYKSAINALEAESAVDLLLAGLQGWKDSALDGIEVQQHMLGHARKQADKARPRIALGSVAPDETSDPAVIIDHRGQVTGRRFVLVTPSGAEGALAGLLGHLEFFESPTFKIVASAGVPLHRYSDSELNKLLASDGNVCVVQQYRGRGTICVKGIATSGDQISVTRIADNAVRRVKAIADRFIGELNDADARKALKQMIVATFTQMERDGALVPSVDGSDGSSPAFTVDVYASQMDAAAGIARVDMAVRPVRAIDYIYATITVKN